MLTTAPHLHVRRPSPTTTEFTVSNLPPQTVPLRLLLALVNILRVLLGLAALLVLYAEWTLSPFNKNSSHNNDKTPLSSSSPTRPAELVSFDSILYLFQLALASAPGRHALGLATRLAGAAPFWVLIPAAVGLILATVRRIHTTESLLVLRGLGIQTSSSGATVLGGPATRFIPTEKIQDVLINEAFRGFEVRYYLVVVVEGEEQVVVVFPKLLPRRAVVERVWRGVRGCLFEVGQRGVVGRNGKA